MAKSLGYAIMALALFYLTPSALADREGRWLLLEVTEDGAEIVNHKHIDHDRDVDYNELGQMHTMSHLHEHGTVSVYYHHKGRTHHRVTQTDPRVMIYEGMGADKQLSGKMKVEERGSFAVTVPRDASHITVQQHAPVARQGKRTAQKAHTLAIRNDKFQTMNTVTAGAIPETIQLVGSPARHVNLVMVSGGFTEAEREKYNAIVGFAVSFLSGEMNLASMEVPVIPNPWDRYYSLINVYSIWQPSPESGASYPQDAYGNGGHPEKGVIRVNNNIDCAYGTENVKMLHCNHQKMLELASLSGADPATQVIMGISNGGIYGGTAGGGKASVYSGLWKDCDITDVVLAAQRCKNGYTFDFDEWPLKDGKRETANLFLNVFLHEMAHAHGKLSDEYSYQIAEPSKLTLYNCYYSTTSPPWQHWVDEGELGAPDAICSYTNYYKPTERRCLLGSASAREMCAACAETQVLFILKNTYELTGPRCPRSEETIVVVANDEMWYLALKENFFTGGKMRKKSKYVLDPYRWSSTYFPAGHKRTDADGYLPLRMDNGEIVTNWKWPTSAATQGTVPATGTLDAPTPTIGFTGNMLGVGEHEFYMEIEDQSDYVKKSAWKDNNVLKSAVDNMNNTAVFKVKVVAPTDSEWSHCTLAKMNAMTPSDFSNQKAQLGLNQCPNSVTGDYALPIASYYCGICAAGQVCNDTFPAVPFEAQGDLESVLADVEATLLTYVLPLAAGVVFGCLLIALVLAWRYKTKPHSVIPYPLPIRIGRVVLLSVQFFVMCATVAVISLAIVMYSSLSVYGKTFAIAAICVAAFLYIVAFYGFLGAWNRSKPALAIAGVLLLLTFIAVLAVTCITMYIASSIDSEELVDTLEKQFVKQVANHPASMCRLQAELNCTGFRSNCLLGASSQCPRDCEITNAKYANPCWKTVRGQIDEYISPASIGLVTLTVVLFISTFLNWAQCCLIRKRKMSIKQRLQGTPQWADTDAEQEKKWAQCRAANILKNLNSREAAQMKKEFAKMDKDKSGCLDAKELRYFYQVVLEINLSEQQAIEVLRASDKDGDGRINFNEFILMHTNDDQEEAAKQKILSDKRLRTLGLPDKTIEKMFHLFNTADMDASGKLQAPELKLIMQKMNKVAPTDEQLQKFIAAVDTDKSGEVDFYECCCIFKQCMVSPGDAPPGNKVAPDPTPAESKADVNENVKVDDLESV